MSKVVNFTVHKNTLEKRKRREVWSQLQRVSKRVGKDIDGFALVCFSSDKDYVETQTEYMCRNTRDLYSIPEMAREKLSKAINKP